VARAMVARHSSRLRLQLHGIDAGSVAHSPGQGFEVCCGSCPWATTACATAFKRNYPAPMAVSVPHLRSRRFGCRRPVNLR
jgi:hypothetical protein